MTLRTRIAGLVLVAAFAASPALALGALACGSCCCPPAPCHGDAAECEAMVSSMSCCDEARAAVPSAAKRTHEQPSFYAERPQRSTPSEQVFRACPSTLGNLDLLVSPLRLSVVLRI